jgi:hypothetical protein
MIMVFMGDQDAVQGLGVDAKSRQAAFDLPGGKTAVDQQPDMGRLQQQGVTPAAAPQRSEAQAHGSPDLLVNQVENALRGL